MKTMQIKIENLTFKCIIGILPFERKNKQKVNINISFKYNYNSKNAKEDFIDYSKIVAFVENSMKKKKFQLIEDALIYLKCQLKENYEIKKLKITIKKPDIIDNCFVGVTN